jgi:hypothetical protein
LQTKYLNVTDGKLTEDYVEFADNAAGHETGTALIALRYCISGAYLVIKAGLYTSAKKYQQTRVVVNIRINREDYPYEIIQLYPLVKGPADIGPPGRS